VKLTHFGMLASGKASRKGPTCAGGGSGVAARWPGGGSTTNGGGTA
jgi:hypothetical protein